MYIYYFNRFFIAGWSFIYSFLGAFVVSKNILKPSIFNFAVISSFIKKIDIKTYHLTLIM